MPETKPDRDKAETKKTPDLDDVVPGSDADATPIAEPGKTPRDPNKRDR